MKLIPLLLTLSIFSIAGISCSPKIEVEVPDKPITINLNVKVEHEIRIQVDQELEQLFDEDDDLF